MDQEHCCGPDHDTDFFNAIAEVFNRFPDAAKKYVIKCIDHETDVMGVDFAEKIGLSRIEGDRVITEFVEARPEMLKEKLCCAWATNPTTKKRFCQSYWA